MKIVLSASDVKNLINLYMSDKYSFVIEEYFITVGDETVKLDEVITDLQLVIK